MLRLLIAFTLLLVSTFEANAQNVPTGNAVLNQAVQARAVVKSDSTVLKATRGIYNGNATACDIALILVNDTVAVTFSNVQSGATLPFAAIQVMSTNTSCSSIVALY